MLLDGLLDKCGYIHRIGGAGEQKNSSPALCIILGVTLWAIVFQIHRSEGKLKKGVESAVLWQCYKLTSYIWFSLTA